MNIVLPEGLNFSVNNEQQNEWRVAPNEAEELSEGDLIKLPAGVLGYAPGSVPST